MMAENDTAEEGKTETEKEINGPLANNELDEAVAAETMPEEEADDEDALQSSEEPEPREQPKKRRASPALRQVIAWFAACGRCSYFLAGYRLIADEEALETAVANQSKKWLALPWSHAMAELIHKTYGSRIDISCYHFEGQCPECHRRFTYQSAEEEGGPAAFRIELKP